MDLNDILRQSGPGSIRLRLDAVSGSTNIYVPQRDPAAFSITSSSAGSAATTFRRNGCNGTSSNTGSFSSTRASTAEIWREPANGYDDGRFHTGTNGGSQQQAEAQETKAPANDKDLQAKPGEKPPPKLITPTPFKWREPALIPPRQLIYGTHYIRKYVSSTLAPGAAGKTTLSIAELLAICTGKPLLGITPHEQCNVWLWNGEDPQDELERKIAATIIHYGVKPEEVEGRLFFDSGREQKIVIAKQIKDGAVICKPVQKHLIQMMRDKQIGVFAVDPFLRSHRVKENDNAAMDEAASAWCEVANETNASVALYQHTRKTNGEEVTVEDSRGAIALPNASRDVRTLNHMTKAEADEAGVEAEKRKRYFRVTSGGKANLVPPVEKSDWFRFVSVELGNGDNVGVVERWKWPSLFEDVALSDLYRVQQRIAEGEWRESEKAKDWAGKVVAEVLEYDLASQAARKQIRKMLTTWVKNKALTIVTRNDSKRMPRKWIEVKEWATDFAP